MRDVSKDEIIDRLTDRIEELVFDLWPGAIKSGAVLLPEPDSTGTSSFQVRLRISGKRPRGTWNRFSQNIGGGPLELIMYAHAGVVTGRTQWYDALKWAKGWLGIGAPETGAARAAREARAAKARATAAEREACEARQVADHVAAITRGCRPVTPGDPVWIYLTEARGLPLTCVPPALCLNPALRHWMVPDHTGPAMVARVANRHGYGGVHCTFLAADGRGKARLGHKAKLMRGDIKGGFVPLQLGPSGRTMRQLMAERAAEDVLVIEGNETGVAVCCAGLPVHIWAALSLGNIAALPFDLPSVARIFWAREADIKPAALRQQERVREALHAHGKPVIELDTPAGSDFADLF